MVEEVVPVIDVVPKRSSVGDEANKNGFPFVPVSDNVFYRLVDLNVNASEAAAGI